MTGTPRQYPPATPTPDEMGGGGGPTLRTKSTCENMKQPAAGAHADGKNMKWPAACVRAGGSGSGRVLECSVPPLGSGRGRTPEQGSNAAYDCLRNTGPVSGLVKMSAQFPHVPTFANTIGSVEASNGLMATGWG